MRNDLSSNRYRQLLEVETDPSDHDSRRVACSIGELGEIWTTGHLPLPRFKFLSLTSRLVYSFKKPLDRSETSSVSTVERRRSAHHTNKQKLLILAVRTGVGFLSVLLHWLPNSRFTLLPHMAVSTVVYPEIPQLLRWCRRALLPTSLQGFFKFRAAKDH